MVDLMRKAAENLRSNIARSYIRMACDADLATVEKQQTGKCFRDEMTVEQAIQLWAVAGD